MPADIADPVTLTPDAWPDGDLRVKLHAHLKIPFESRLRDRIGPRSGRVTLEAVDHGVEVTFLRRFIRRGDGSAVDGFMKDRVVRVMFLHSVQVIRALEEMRALAAGVFRAYGLAVNALCGKTLFVGLERHRTGRTRTKTTTKAKETKNG